MGNSETGSAYDACTEQGREPFSPGVPQCRPVICDDGVATERRRPAGTIGSRPAGEPTVGGGQLAWFAVLTRSRHERTVHDQLMSKGVESFLPSVSRWSRWRDRRKLIDWPLFPGYCFARCEWPDIRPVLVCKGVVQLVSFAARPTPVPDYEIDGIKQLLASTLPHDPCPFIDVGMMVKVVYGPLRGVRGRLIGKERSTRLVLGIEMLGRALSVQVDAADVVSLGTRQ